MAAADFASGGEPPPEYELATYCERWHALPESGGLFDQPAGLVKRMTIVSNVVKTFQAMYQSENWAKWMTDNPDAAKLINEVNALRGK